MRKTRIPKHMSDGEFKDLKGLPARMRLLRFSQGCRSKAAFARKTGIDEDTIGLWEKGGRPTISPANAAKLRATTRVTIDWLYFGDEASLPGQLLRELQEFKKRGQKAHVEKKLPRDKE